MLSLVADHAKFIERIETLSADSKREWGKLTLPQMLAHCRKPLLVASGELQLKRGLIGFLFGRMAKKKFVDSDAPFNRNSPTDPKFLDPDADDVASERAGLIEQVRAFAKTGPPSSVHPFFGAMSENDWDRLMWKHLDHHLRQFGA